MCRCGGRAFFLGVGTGMSLKPVSAVFCEFVLQNYRVRFNEPLVISYENYRNLLLARSITSEIYYLIIILGPQPSLPLFPLSFLLRTCLDMLPRSASHQNKVSTIFDQLPTTNVNAAMESNSTHCISVLTTRIWRPSLITNNRGCSAVYRNSRVPPVGSPC